MTTLTQWLPVASIPEQFFVTLVWFDMVYYCCWCEPAFSFTDNTQRMLPKKYFTCTSPLPVISTLMWCHPISSMLRLVLLTVFIFCKVRAAGMLAGFLWLCWHIITPFKTRRAAAERRKRTAALVIRGAAHALSASLIQILTQTNCPDVSTFNLKANKKSHGVFRRLYIFLCVQDSTAFYVFDTMLSVMLSALQTA